MKKIILLSVFLLLFLSQVKVCFTQERNTAFSFETLTEPESTLEFFTLKREYALSTQEFVQKYLSVLNLSPNSEMRFVRMERDELGFTHSRYQQYVNGYKVMEAEMIVHEKDGSVQYINGMYKQDSTPLIAVNIQEQRGLQIALREINSSDYLWLHKDVERQYRKMKQDSSATLYPSGELMYVPSTDNNGTNKLYHLCWKFTIAVEPATESYDVYVDAYTGIILRKIPNTLACNTGTGNTLWNGTRTLYTTFFGAGYLLQNLCNPASVVTLNGNGNSNGSGSTAFIDNDNTWPSDALGKFAAQTHFGSQQARNYYSSVHGREGYNNSGHSYTAYINAGYTNNAYFTYSTEAVSYGGNADGSQPFVSLDVAGHEHTHGMIYFTSNLTYAGESGALNESFADCLGEAIEAYTLGTPDWIMAQELGSLRSFSNPNALSQPDTYQGNFWQSTSGCTSTGWNDNCGVHVNSGVQNFWFYLLSQGGSGTNDNGANYCVSGIGINKARMIAYNTMINLTSGSAYGNARLMAIQVAKNLYGVNSNEAVQTANAWSAVGVGPAQYLPPDPTISIVASNNNYCTGTVSSVTFTATVANATSPSYQWYVNGVGIAGAIGTTFVSTTIKNRDSVRCEITFIPNCPYSPGILSSNTINMVVHYKNNAIINTTVNPSTICEGSSTTLSASTSYAQPVYNYGTTGGHYIGRVALLNDNGIPTNFNNISGASSYPYHTVYPATGNTTITLNAGSWYMIQLSAGTNTSNNYFAAWIDFDHDSSFSIKEKIGNYVYGPLGAYPDIGLFTGSFIVPPTAKNGLTRLRVREVYNTPWILPDTTYDFGETEDYYINIINGQSTTNPIQYYWSYGTSPSAGTTVIATPAYSQQYTVTVSDAYGCTTTTKTNPVLVNSMNIQASASPVVICPGGTSTLSASPGSNYCIPQYTGSGTTTGTYINSIQINDITLGGFGTTVMLFTSGTSSAPYYTLFPTSGNSTASLIAGHTYKLFINSGTAGNNSVTAFIDYDQNKNLNIGLEKLGERTVGASASTNMTFTIPSVAKNGLTRFRLRINSDGYFSAPCDLLTANSGETEDYTITISGGVNAMPPSFTWNPNTNPVIGNSVAATPSTSTNYVVTATDADGCMATATIPVMVTTLPSITASASPASICAGNISTLTVSSATNAICQPIYTSGSGGGDFINSVYLFNPIGGTLDNFTGASSAPYYTIYPQSGTTTTTLSVGSTYYLSVYVGSYSSYNNVAAWIDYNGDGIWFNALEKLGETGDINTAYGLGQIVFKVPSWARNGTCRLRIREVYSMYNLNPCDTYTFGETEDYLITITGGVNPGAVNYTWSPATMPSTGMSVMASPNAVTVYTVTASGDYGCSNTTTVEVNMNINASFSSNAASTCAGSVTQFNAAALLCSGNALNGNGTNIGALISNSYPVTATTNFSVEAWVKWNGQNGNNQYIYYTGNSSSNGYGIFINASNNNQLAVRCGTTILNTTTTLNPNTWHHVVITRAGTLLPGWKLYVDGTQYTLTNSSTAAVTPSSGGTYVGRNTSGEYFNGAIDEVRVWNIALSSTQIASNRVGCISTILNLNLVGYWNFNETTGASCFDQTTGAKTLTLSDANARTPSASYSWNFGDGGTASGINPSHQFVTDGNYTVTLTTTDITGCAASSVQPIVILPCNTTITIKCFIEGYLTGLGIMTPVLLNEGVSLNLNDVDSVTMELHDVMMPFNLIASATGMLKTDGSLSCTFNGMYYNNSYYIVVKHRNALETWSALPVNLNYMGSQALYYDFSSSPSKAYGNNQTQSFLLTATFFSGDVNQDGAIDVFDYLLVEPDIVNGYSGYLNSDLNGDGVVDAFDYLVIESNIVNGISVAQP